MMQRFGMMIRLKPGSEESYKRYHAAVWPEDVASVVFEITEEDSVFKVDRIIPDIAFADHAQD